MTGGSFDEVTGTGRGGERFDDATNDAAPDALARVRRLTAALNQHRHKVLAADAGDPTHVAREDVLRRLFALL